MVLEPGRFSNTKQSADKMKRCRKKDRPLGNKCTNTHTHTHLQQCEVWTLQNPHWASTGLGCKVLFARLYSMQAGCTAHLCEECRGSQDLSFTIGFDPVLTQLPEHSGVWVTLVSFGENRTVFLGASSLPPLQNTVKGSTVQTIHSWVANTPHYHNYLRSYIYIIAFVFHSSYPKNN